MFFSTTSSSVRKSNTRSDDITRTTGLEGLAVDPWTGGECHGDKDLVRTGLDASGPVKRERTRRSAHPDRFPVLFTGSSTVLRHWVLHPSSSTSESLCAAYHI